jgi:hypothetical protein
MGEPRHRAATGLTVITKRYESQDLKRATPSITACAALTETILISPVRYVLTGK